MRDRERDPVDRSQGFDSSDLCDTDAPLGRVAGKIIIGGVVGMAYVFLKPG